MAGGRSGQRGIGRWAAAAAVAALQAGAAQAQERAPQPEDEETVQELEEARREGRLEEMVVFGSRLGRYGVREASTGLRTEADVLDIPGNVKVIPEALIEDQAAFTVSEALQNVSGVSFVTGGEGAGIFSRGFGALVLRDGFLRSEFTGGDVNATDLNTANIDRIEVLKGPASVLYGRTNPGGLINLVTKRPKPELFTALGFSAGSFDLYRGTLDISVPVAPKHGVGIRLVGAYEDSGSFRDVVENEIALAAPSIAWQIGPDTYVSLAAEYARVEAVPDNGVLIDETGAILDGLSRETFLGEPTDFQIDERVQLFFTFDHRLIDVWRVRARATYSDTDNLLNTTAPEVVLDDGVSVERFFTISEFNFEDVRTELQAQADFFLAGRPNQILVGVDYAHRNTESVFGGALAGPLNIFDPMFGDTQLFDFDGNPTDSVAFGFQQQLERDSIGGFLQHRLDLTDQLILVSGVRVDHIEQRAAEGAAGNFDEIVLEDTPDGVDTEASPRVGLVYQPTEHLSLYFQWSRSFQPPNGVPIDASGSVLEPETGRLFEAGVKVDFAGLSATLAGFRIDRDQVPFFDLVTGAFLAAGEQQSQGLDFDLQGEILPSWNINFAYAFIDAEVTEDGFVPSGSALQDIPRHSVNLWSVYEFEAGPLDGLGLGGGIRYVGDRAANPDNSFFLPSFVQVDATIFYEWNERVTLRLNALNITDEDILLNAGSDFTVNPGAPRSFIGTVSVKF